MPQDPRHDRRLDVLRALVREYIATGEAVGSRTVASRVDCAISPATVRHVLADLGDLGLVTKAHSSAGRIPTEEGFRQYVDTVLRERRPVSGQAHVLDLPGAADPRSGGLESFLAMTSQMLSRLCGCVGIVLHPRMGLTRFRHASFLRLAERRLVAVIVDQDGLVSDRIVAPEEDYTQEELDGISSYLGNRFQGSTLLDVQRQIEQELKDERAAYDAALHRSLTLTLRCLRSGSPQEEMYVEGAAQCVESPEFADVERVRQLLRAYEQKDRIARLLWSCLERQGILVQIGETASGEPSLRGLVVIGAQYGESGRPLGSLGVLGPTRMEYERVISVVETVARDLSLRLTGTAASH